MLITEEMMDQELTNFIWDGDLILNMTFNAKVYIYQVDDVKLDGVRVNVPTTRVRGTLWRESLVEQIKHGFVYGLIDRSWDFEVL